MTNYEIISLIIQALIALAAIVIGAWQIIINLKLKALQDYLAIAIVPGDTSIIAINTGKRNLYIHRFEIPGNTQIFDRPRMIPAGVGDKAHYWLPIPDPKIVERRKVFPIIIYLTDQYGKKYISYNEGVLQGEIFIVWSNETVQKSWSF